MTRITGLRTADIRFPTSAQLDGSDAMNPDPDYSAAYVILDTDMPGLEGHGLTFTQETTVTLEDQNHHQLVLQNIERLTF